MASSTPSLVYAGRPRAGRRFEPVHERELLNDALWAAGTIRGAHRGVRVIVESAGPLGVPDLVAVIGPPEVMDARLALDVPPLLNQVDAAVVAVATAKIGRTAEALADRVGWPVGTVRRRLPQLLRSGALTERKPGHYVRPAALKPVGRLYAIESKVKEWRRAVRQARAYGVWCDNYVIVMPELTSSASLGVLEAVDQDHGGLVLGRRWIRRPLLGSRPSASRLWGSEHVIAAFYG